MRLQLQKANKQNYDLDSILNTIQFKNFNTLHPGSHYTKQSTMIPPYSPYTMQMSTVPVPHDHTYTHTRSSESLQEKTDRSNVGEAVNEFKTTQTPTFSLIMYTAHDFRHKLKMLHFLVTLRPDSKRLMLAK